MNDNYDGGLNSFDAVNSYLDGDTVDGNGTQHSLPTTPQDETPHNDGLFGRNYTDQFDGGQTGRNGGNVLGVTEDGDHYDVIEQDPGTGNMYHNRVFDPGQ